MLSWKLVYEDGTIEYVKATDGDEACSMADYDKILVSCDVSGPAFED